MQDSGIIDLYWQRDDSAIAQTLDKYGARLLQLAKNILQHAEDSAECVNDVCYKVWQSIPPHRPDNFYAFLRKITREHAIDLYRRQNSERRRGSQYALSLEELSECLSESVSGDDPAISAEYAALTAAINAFVLSLPEEQRQLFLWRYYFADPIATIAQRTHLREATVKSRLFRLRAGLKEHLAKEGFSV